MIPEALVVHTTFGELKSCCLLDMDNYRNCLEKNRKHEGISLPLIAENMQG
jgi:hypothetical protein